MLLTWKRGWESCHERCHGPPRGVSGVGARLPRPVLRAPSRTRCKKSLASVIAFVVSPRPRWVADGWAPESPTQCRRFDLCLAVVGYGSFREDCLARGAEVGDRLTDGGADDLRIELVAVSYTHLRAH